MSPTTGVSLMYEVYIGPIGEGAPCALTAYIKDSIQKALLVVMPSFEQQPLLSVAAAPQRRPTNNKLHLPSEVGGCSADNALMKYARNMLFFTNSDK